MDFYEAFLTLDSGKEISDKSILSDPLINRFVNHVKNISAKYDHISKSRTESHIRFLLSTSFIKSLAADLDKNRIDIILLKSTALNGSIYKVDKVREFSDLDIYVGQKKKNTFNSILKYKSQRVNTNSYRAFSDAYEESWVTRTAPHQYIDVHHHLVNHLIFNFDEELCFANSLVHPLFKSANIRMFNNEMQFIHLAVHVILDGYLNHHSMVDILFLLKSRKLRPDVLKKITLESKCKNAIQFVAWSISTKGCNFIADDLKIVHKPRFHILRLAMSKRFTKNSILRRIQQIIIILLASDSFRHSCSFILSYLKK